MHSAKTSFVRGKDKTEALRRAGIGNEDCNLLGMNNGDYSDVHLPGKWPLLRLREVLSNTTRSGVPLGNPVKYDKFDA